MEMKVGKPLSAGIVIGVLGTFAGMQCGLAQTPAFPMIVDGSGASINRDALRKAAKLVTEKLKDPYSTQFQNVGGPKTDKGAICGQFNTKNLYGAYTGFRWFLTIPSQNIAIIEPEEPSEITNANDRKQILISYYELKKSLLGKIREHCEDAPY